MRLIAFSVFISVCLNCCGQVNPSNSCSNVIEKLSYFWKLDSSGSNGYRYLAYRELEKCKIDSVDTSLLFRKLGKPNHILKSNTGVDYLYYYLDSRKLPSELQTPLACWYVSFFFKGGDTMLKSISVGSLEL